MRWVCTSACQEQAFGLSPARLNLPTNSTLFCRQWTDGSTCLRALPGDLHDALIIQIFDSHEVSDFVWFHSVPLRPLRYQRLVCFHMIFRSLTLCACLCFCRVAKLSTALWTRARLHRLVCPPTTTLCWASTTRGTTSHYERLVHNTHMLTHLSHTWDPDMAEVSSAVLKGCTM